MKKVSTILFLFMVAFLHTNAQFERNKQVYQISDLRSLIAPHKKVAIVPFKGQISYKRMPKGFDAEANKAEERKLGLNLQEGLYTFLLRKHDNYFVNFQEPEHTNALLKKAGIYDNMDAFTYDSIAKILGVDAVISSTYTYEKTSSEAGAIAKAVIFGGGASTASGTLTLKLFNGTDGELYWRFVKEMNEGAFSSAGEVVERMMRKVSRNFPYTR
ncbi:MAG: hypothetical protein V4717_22025 [Bacteroidota bacterium]